MVRTIPRAIQLGKCEVAREAALTAMEELKDKLEEREWELKEEIRMERGGNEAEGKLAECMSDWPSPGAHISYQIGLGG